MKPPSGVNATKKRIGSKNSLVNKATGGSKKGLYDPVLERDFVVIAKKYLFGECIYDVLANAPTLIYMFYFGLP